MFTLRKVSSKGVMNIALGDSYTLINRERSQEEFKKTSINVFDGDNAHEKKVRGFIVTEGAKQLIPYYESEGNYIMTENGKTYECLK